jgi:calpain-15
MDRHKNTESADFYDIVNAQSTDYLDEEFPTNDAHYFFDGGQNDTKSGMVSHASKDSWHRIKDGGYFKETLSLFGDDYIRPEDIRQGEIGNCWYLSSITALAEYPGRIESAFLNKTLSQAGVYGVQMYALGVPVTVMVDDYLPLVGSSGSRTRYSKVGGDGSLWGPIMEKAFAKFHGNYARIVAGDPVAGVSTMNGSPYERIWS